MVRPAIEEVSATGRAFYASATIHAILQDAWNRKVTWLPLSELKCVSPKRRLEMAARLGGAGRRAASRIPGPWLPPPLFRLPSLRGRVGNGQFAVCAFY